MWLSVLDSCLGVLNPSFDYYYILSSLMVVFDWSGQPTCKSLYGMLVEIPPAPTAAAQLNRRGHNSAKVE